MITNRNIYQTGRLTARLGQVGAGAEITTGLQPLGLDPKKDGLLYVPKGYNSAKPAALAVMLHGSGGSADQGMSLLRRYADAYNVILISPASRKYTWDIIASQAFGPDVIFIDQALEAVFQKYVIDPEQVAVGGFSDGASYALCLGLTNGDLFTHIIAFSAGFFYTIEKHGAPAVFISHGVQDAVLPIDPCGRKVVPQLKRQGLEVNYLEFEGEHEIPLNISQSAIDWFIA